MNRTDTIARIFENMASFKRLLAVSHGAKCLAHTPTPSQVGILLLIARQGPQNLKDLAKCMCMTSSAATQLVDGLVQDGMLTRTEDTDDRRRIRLALSAAGRRRLSLARKWHLAAFAKLLEPLSENELNEWKRLQQKILDHAT